MRARPLHALRRQRLALRGRPGARAADGEPLPEGWEQRTHPSGKPQYFNTATSELTWTRPQRVRSELELAEERSAAALGAAARGAARQARLQESLEQERAAGAGGVQPNVLMSFDDARVDRITDSTSKLLKYDSVSN